MNWKEFTADYLSFSRRDRIGIVAILILIVVIFLLPRAISQSASPAQAPSDSSWASLLRDLEEKPSSARNTDPQDDPGKFYAISGNNPGDNDKPRNELFEFDPNTLAPESWARLGLREKTVRTIQNYLSKGGRFKKAADLQKIYGLQPDEYERIAPFVRIESTWTKITEEAERSGPGKGFVAVPAFTKARYEIIDVNTADTTAFIALPGIGSKLASRIISFREKLGGFYSIAQVGETYGLPDSTFQKIKSYLKLENIAVKKININTATLDELKTHPYIRYSLANPIVAYRKEHGPFTKPEDLKKVMAVTEEAYQKFSPYINTD